MKKLIVTFPCCGKTEFQKQFPNVALDLDIVSEIGKKNPLIYHNVLVEYIKNNSPSIDYYCINYMDYKRLEETPLFKENKIIFVLPVISEMSIKFRRDIFRRRDVEANGIVRERVLNQRKNQLVEFNRYVSYCENVIRLDIGEFITDLYKEKRI